MTAKELLYVEDALGHEKYFQTKCNEALNTIKDEKLRSCIEDIAKKHDNLYNNFYTLL